MLRAHKFLDLNNCLIKICSEIIILLSENELMKYDELYKSILNKNEQAEDMFLPALNFLFLLGKIRYHKDSDVVELI